MAALGVDRHSVRYDRSARTYWIRELDLRLPPAHHHLLPALGDAVLLKRAGVSFANCNEEIVANTGTFSVTVNSREELFILKEIIAQGTYSIMSSEAAIVLDVGMNVGFASLYFAAQPRVLAVWSYEPVADTYDRALRNLERNPVLAAKVRPRNYGLSDRAGETTFDFCSQWPAAVGVCGLSSDFQRFHGVKANDISRITVQLQSVSDTVRELRAVYPETEAIMKVDCEGAEYPIIAELRCAGLLRDIDVFLIEWHERGPRELEHALASAGFFVSSFISHGTTTGMVYAYKRALVA
jgi:FkbM family methyltransferase